MIDHVSLQVGDVPASRAFHESLTPLGRRAAYTDHDAVGFAEGPSAPCWILPAASDERRELHLALPAADRDAVLAFHAAAVGFGAEVLRAPRLFPTTTTSTSPASSATRTDTTSKPSAARRRPRTVRSTVGPTHDGAPHEGRPVRAGA